MKHFLLILTFCFTTFTVKSQNTNASVEQSIFGIQTGILGVWAHNESKLTNSIALRTEVGFDGSIWGGSFFDDSGFLITPVISVAPRFYYNLKKRLKKQKKITGNNGNYISLQTRFHPDWFVISNSNNVSIISQLALIPSWGIRRAIGKHFNYETGVGIGYRRLFAKQAGFTNNESDTFLNLHLRIGYQF